MATKIRLARGGRKAVPHYSVVVITSTRKQTGKFIEKIGHYHPLRKDNDPERVVLNTERLQYWLGVGAIPSDRVISFMCAKNIPGSEKFKKSAANPQHAGMSKKDIAEAKKKAQADADAAKKAAQAKREQQAAEQAAVAAATEAGTSVDQPAAA